MAIIGAIVRIYSFLFHLVISLFILGVAIIAFTSGTHNLQMDMLPWWQGSELTYWLLGLGVLGIISVALAVTRKLPVLFLLWSIAVLVLLIRGYIFSPYTFAGVNEFQRTLLLILGAFFACIGAWLQFRRKPARREAY